MKQNKPIRVNSIEIQNFRGISCKQTLNLSKDFVVLWGENGTGKSSFVGAFEYLFREKLDALDFKAEGNKDAFYHKGTNKEEFYINLTVNGGQKFYRDINGPDFPWKLMNKHRSFLREASFILTRKTLLKFINEGDTERFNAFLDLCGLSEINRLRKEINSTKNKYAKVFTEIEKKLENSKEKLSSILEIEDGSEEKFVSVINKELKSINKDLITSHTDLNEYLLHFDINELVQIVKINEFISGIDISKISEEFKNILLENEKLSNDNLVNLKYSRDLLENSKAYLEKTGDDVCPVCDSSIDKDEVILNIDGKLKNVEDSLEKLDNWELETDNYINSLNELKFKINEVNKFLDKISEDIIDISYIDSLIKDIEKLKQLKITNIELYQKYDFNEFSDKIEHVKNIINSDAISINEEKYEKIKKIRQAIQELVHYKKILSKFKISKSKYEFSKSSLDAFDDAKWEIVGEIINKISGHVQEYYEFIHGEDMIRSPELKINNSNKIKIYLESFGKSSEPRQFSSEGHLDTLGLCIFLAFMKEYNPLDLIILDDIITTVDFSHKYQIAKLLLEKFGEFKFLITTHNGLWVQQLKNLTDYYKKNCEEFHLTSWDYVLGPTLFAKKGYPERIRKLIESDEPQISVNAARKYLEYTMLEFCRNNKVNIRLSNHYTLDPLKKAVRFPSIEKSKEFEEIDTQDFEDLWKEFDEKLYLLNKLSHYNDDAFYVHSNEIKQLCELSLKLCEAIIFVT